jgi:hypothetical protein
LCVVIAKVVTLRITIAYVDGIGRSTGGGILAVNLLLAAGAINVNSLNRGAVISVGQISQPGWNLSGKSNFGNSQLFGCNLEFAFMSTLLDNDVFDNPIGIIEPNPTMQAQTL